MSRAFVAVMIAGIMGVATIASGQVGQQQQDPTQRIRGTITSVAGNKGSFQINDRNGNPVTILVNGKTKYHFRNVDGTFDEVVAKGDDVNAMVGQDGFAVDVFNRNRGKLMALQYKDQLEVGDAEWSVIEPKLVRVLLLMREERGDDVAFNQPSRIAQAQDDLTATLRNQVANNADIQRKLGAFHDAKSKVAKELEQARAELVEMLTVRQEAVLVKSGVLE